MRITKMRVFKNSDNNKITGFYGAKIKLSGAQNSRAVVMPDRPVSSIAVHQTGSALIYLTNYSYQNILSNHAKWVLYDDVSEINTGVTAIKAVNAAGNTTIQITVLRKL